MTFRFVDRRVLYFVAVAALVVVEVFFAVNTESKYDMGIWFKTGYWMNNGINIYQPDNHLGYPPLWALWCSAAYSIFGFSGSSLEAWRLAIKLPMILAQFAIAALMWKFADERFDKKTASKIFWVTLSCSFFVFIGAMWGQINIVSVFLTFLAFYAVINKRTGIGALFLGLAVALKIYPLIVLPAFLAYLYRNRTGKEAAKFLVYSCTVPVLVTAAIIAAYGWDVVYFLRTVFYWTPVFESNPTQIQGGCMNIWSFAGLNGVEISQIWLLRFLWIPILGAAAIYWFRKRSLNETDFNLSLISFYLLFMISYGWVTEQTFLDPLPFIFLQILAYRPVRAHLYGLVGIQLLVYAFSSVNGGPMIFEPLFSRFYPDPISPLTNLSIVNSTIAWTIRGTLGLVISVALGLYLIFLAKPDWLAKAKGTLRRTLSARLENGRVSS